MASVVCTPTRVRMPGAATCTWLTPPSTGAAVTRSMRSADFCSAASGRTIRRTFCSTFCSVAGAALTQSIAGATSSAPAPSATPSVPKTSSPAPMRSGTRHLRNQRTGELSTSVMRIATATGRRTPRASFIAAMPSTSVITIAAHATTVLSPVLGAIGPRDLCVASPSAIRSLRVGVVEWYTPSRPARPMLKCHVCAGRDQSFRVELVYAAT